MILCGAFHIPALCNIANLDGAELRTAGQLEAGWVAMTSGGGALPPAPWGTVVDCEASVFQYFALCRPLVSSPWTGIMGGGENHQIFIGVLLALPIHWSPHVNATSSCRIQLEKSAQIPQGMS